MLAYPLRFLDQFLDRVIAGLGAILLAQFPQYFGQYLQRLGGHLNELRHQVAEYEEAAASLGLTLGEYINEHLQAGSEIFVSTGRIMVELTGRLAEMEAAFAAFGTSRQAGLYQVCRLVHRRRDLASLHAWCPHDRRRLDLRRGRLAPGLEPLQPA